MKLKEKDKAEFDIGFFKELEDNGHKVPKDYLGFIEGNNEVVINGYPKIEYFDQKVKSSTDIFVIYGTKTHNSYNLEEMNRKMNKYLPSEGVDVSDYICIAEDSAGNVFLLGTKGEVIGKVYIYVIDYNDIFFVANSFSDLLSSIMKNN